MKTIPITALLLAMATGALAEIRTWTSADDASKTFEGELVSAAKGSVVIKRKDGKSLTVPETKLSQADRDFVTAEQEKLAAAEKTKEAAAKLKTSPMAAGLSGKTVSLQGKSLKKYDILAAKAPEYYLCYWGASWCGPCMQAAPKLVALYDEKIAKSTNVEVVLISWDNDEAGLKKFMTDLSMKFPAVPKDKAAKIKLIAPLEPQSIPTYKLLDAEGKVIAEGEAAKHKAGELAAGTAVAAAADTK